ncbi:adenylylsulfate reductase, thioredoxin dependent [Paenibacillus vortex V453]|jgi:phosphoadenosine phosphosulfate reductase|uniref:Adenosine 5'-phosphosulfate reductase n=1 Tax=Paenibacillus vortex V453 TaxID=715225 RepID=A0A2R9SLJ7_9BACL|nr:MULTISPECIES: phosphoadenylyl-sulfate reductase [Paenibacillus]ANA79630.1 phosphoadenosine phosphosulfate reductase [Paenibacillus glucanolyticus]AVV56375.1 phosphoadenylyl-sulfate reductase [Paenibacillus glucanolyticus]AWP25583.1 phosphoadenosine phosphosulfate reductase [Paenibacillus sp. Cedars]EFU38228.1 adenylylsulfate reductase, thioredoxin dependent [Paenibacillus vortex V453]ETT41020.1 adenylylsulfate reductase, thioredoxin dependent [Paenibacillus sp. FSL R5-808]
MNLLEKEDLIRVQAEELEHATAEEVIAFAIKTFPNITFACSFGAEDVVLVDMIQKISPSTDIFYLDTDFHFKETYETRDRMAEHYSLEFVKVSPLITPEEQAAQFGEELWRVSPNECCNIRKVEPLTRILSQYEAWITGIRRDQAPTRANSKKIEYDTKFGLVKFNPIAAWTSEDVWNYIRANDIIYNPLHDQNYPSIGCEYCTRQVFPGEDPRAGRWSGHEKTECGLHK